MSELRHATVLLVLELLSRETSEEVFGEQACGAGSRGDAATWLDADALRSGQLPPDKRITCDRCAIIVDAALEGVKPFPFSLPGVPDEVLR